MGIAERRARQKVEMRELILNAARDLFAEQGFEAVTMREIAQRIEYSPTAIYGHFKDKMTLLQDLCAVDFLEFAQSFDQAAREKDPIERLKKIGLAYVRFALENPNHYRFMFMMPLPEEAEPSAESLREYKGRPDKDAYALLRTTVDAALKTGRFRPGFRDADEIAQVLWAGVHGVAALHIARANDRWIPWRPVEKSARVLVEAVLHGFLEEKK